MELVQIVVIALLVEAIWETLKMCWQDGKFSWDRVGALAVAVAICLVCKANLFIAVGVDIPGVVGYVLTGVLASRGSNFLHDLIERINGGKYEIVYSDEPNSIGFHSDEE